MSALNATEIIDQGEVASDSGIAFALTEAVFARWWKSLPQEHRDEFVSVHHGCPQGNTDLARYVCALDHLLIQRKQSQTAGLLMDAWALATGANAHDKATAIAAGEAWQHDAVQQLLFRIRDQQSRQAVARIERLITANLESDLTSEDTKRRTEAMKSGLAFMRLVEERETRERDMRAKRGLERIQGDLAKVEHAFERPTSDQAKQYLRAIADIFGPTEFARILQHALPTEAK